LNFLLLNSLLNKSICNEPRVFQLFIDIPRFKDGYTREHAKGFVESAKQGWEEDSKYTFFIKNPNDEIVACLDIKSSDINNGEIGYWASERYSGVMTNAVIKLLELAKKGGFYHLHALIKSENEKSAKVVTKAGLKFIQTIEEEGNYYKRFEITL
jgi:RimJ/RimL family protein N-acetyltransferase